MQPYIYGHNRPVYLRQLGRTYIDRPEIARPLIAALDPADEAIVLAEVATIRAQRGDPLLPVEVLRAELFGQRR